MEQTWQEGAGEQLQGIFHYGRSLFLGIFLSSISSFVFLTYIKDFETSHCQVKLFSRFLASGQIVFCSLCFITHPCWFFLKCSSRSFFLPHNSALALTDAYLLNSNFKCYCNIMERIYTLQLQMVGFKYLNTNGKAEPSTHNTEFSFSFLPASRNIWGSGQKQPNTSWLNYLGRVL